MSIRFETRRVVDIPSSDGSEEVSVCFASVTGKY